MPDAQFGARLFLTQARVIAVFEVECFNCSVFCVFFESANMEGIVSRRLLGECACGSWIFEFGVCAQVKFGHCVRITNRILEKYGHTPGCIGCEAALAGGPVAG